MSKSNSSLKHYKQALLDLQEAEKDFKPARGYWFYVQSRNPAPFKIEDYVSLYTDYQAEPFLQLPWTEENVKMVRYIAAVHNLSLPALKHIIILEDAIMGLTSEEFKDKLIKELAEDI